MLKPKLQYFDPLMRRANSLEKILMLGKIEGRRRRGWQRMRWGWHHWLLGHEFEETLWDSEGQGSLACWSPWGLKELEMTEWLNQTEDSKCVQSSGYIVWFNVEMKSKLTQSETWNYCLMFNVWDVVSPARWTKKNKVSSESCLLFGNIWVKKKKKVYYLQ